MITEVGFRPPCPRDRGIHTPSSFRTITLLSKIPCHPPGCQTNSTLREHAVSGYYASACLKRITARIVFSPVGPQLRVSVLSSTNIAHIVHRQDTCADSFSCYSCARMQSFMNRLIVLLLRYHNTRISRRSVSLLVSYALDGRFVPRSRGSSVLVRS